MEGKEININEHNYKCESCGNYFDPEKENYGTDDDNNAFCNKCCKEMTQFGGWGVFKDYPDEWHIRPVDEPDHLHDQGCHCEPKVVQENGIDIVTHNSFDGREYVEQALDLLK